MLDSLLTIPLSNHTIDTLYLNDIEDYSDEEWHTLCQLLSENKSLTAFYLYLSSDRYTEDPHTLSIRRGRVSALLTALQAHPALQEFELSLGSMDIMGRMDIELIHDLSEFIECNTNIQLLSLPDNRLKHDHLHLLFPAIYNNLNIHSINFSTNCLKTDSMTMLKKIATSRPMSCLDVSYNNLRGSAIELLLIPASIDYLNLSGNKINKYGMNNLYNRLINPNKISVFSTKKLVLNDNPIACKGGNILAKIFELGFEFDEIHLTFTKMQNEQVVAVCNALAQSNTPVQVLNLKEIYIKPSGAKAISTLTLGSNSLKSLTLSYDKIHPDAHPILFKIISNSIGLKKLHVPSFRDSNEQENLDEAFWNAFRKNKSLESILYGSHSFSEQDARIYSAIILEDFDALVRMLMDDLSENSKEKLMPRLNLCNTFINRIENYYRFDHYRGPLRLLHSRDSSKEALFSLEPEFKRVKEKFHKLSMRMSLYEEIIKEKAPQAAPLFDKNLNGVINEFVGYGFHNIFLTNFMLEKSKQRGLLVEDEKKECELVQENIQKPQKKKRKING